MGQLTNYTEKKILDHVLKTASYSPPATVYLGLSTTTPSPDGTGWTEAAYTGYGNRPAIAFGAAAAKAIAQNAVANFPACTGGSSTVTYWGIFDAITGGNLLAYGALSPSKVIASGNTPSVASGQVTVTINAGGMFQKFANSVLAWLFAAGSLSVPTDVEIGLSTTTPVDGADNGSGTNITEPSGNGYAQVAQDSWHAASGSPEAAANNGTITLGPPTGSWGACTYGIAYLDTLPAFYGTIISQTPNNGDTVEYLDSQFSVSVQ
jgi:hypothetical protein